MNSYDPTPAASAPDPFPPSTPSTLSNEGMPSAEGTLDAGAVRLRRRRRPALAAAFALAVVATVGGGARVVDLHSASLLSSRFTPYLTTNSATVASSVNGALVDIVSTLGYQNGKAAGTGMVLTSTGEILTNNHVIDGSTSLKVTVVATGRTYSASVVGTDPTQDVAVIQLAGASGLKTVPIGDSSTLKLGQTVTASGNAGGVGGTPSMAKGSITALEQSITASDQGSNAEQLTGLIETNAPIVAGDSGGPLSSSGKVIGMDTAASSTNAISDQTGRAAEAYAIPIRTALTIAHQIETGVVSSTIHQGVHGFLGVELQSQTVSNDFGNGSNFGNGNFGSGGFYGAGGFDGDETGTSSSVSGATLAGVVDSGAAASAGLQAGDVITSVDGHAVTSVSTLNTIMASTTSGQKVSLGWTDSGGQSHTASVTLGAAAAD